MMLSSIKGIRLNQGLNACLKRSPVCLKRSQGCAKRCISSSDAGAQKAGAQPDQQAGFI